MSDDDLRAKLTEALMHHVECVMTAPDSFGWHCLTCSVEVHSWSTLEAAERASLGHHAEALLPVVRAALAEAWDAGWEMRETARLHGREGDNNLNPWREVQP